MSPQYFDSGEAGLRDVVVFYDLPVASIPALSDWGVIGLSALLAVSLSWMLRHRGFRDAHADEV
jgi:hypothetical protein